MPRWEKTKFTHEFVGKGEEEFVDIVKRKGNGYAAYILETGVELTDRIMEMVEGESPEVLEEIERLLIYHAGYKARIFTGNDPFEKIINDTKWSSLSISGEGLLQNN
jgi:hypothetical protein